MLLFFAFLARASNDCPAAYLRKDFALQMDSIELSFIEADIPNLELQIESLDGLAACLSERMIPELAARYHLIKGIYAFVSNNEEIMKASFSVAKRVDPAISISTHVFPKEHVVHDIYSQIKPVTYVDIKSKPSQGSYFFDGLMLSRRPVQAPTYIQIIDNEKVLLAQYLQTEMDIPKLSGKTYHKPIALGVSAGSMIVAGYFFFSAHEAGASYLERKEDVIQGEGKDLEVAIEELNSNFDKNQDHFLYSMIATGVSLTTLGISFVLEW